MPDYITSRRIISCLSSTMPYNVSHRTIVQRIAVTHVNVTV